MALAKIIKYEGDNSTFVWKSPIQDFNTMSQLIVHESQEAVFFKNGQALDVFEAGRYTLQTQNIPLIKRFLNLPTGGKTPFHCEVYFINKAQQMAIKWGTDSQVQYMEPTYKFPLQIGVSGEMTLSVGDSRRLLVKLVGTESQLTQAGLVAQFRSYLMSIIKPYIASTMQTAPYAKAAFESLGNYKDSKEMIESINQIIIENKYERAESYFNSQNYVEAIKLYKELGDYKDSKQKIEKIKNRLATEDVLYYGSYENEPIAWQEIKTENNRMLLIAKDSVCDLPYNDEIKNIQWSESSLESWLNDEFINAFSEDQLSSIVAEDVDGVKSKVFLLGENDIVNIENTTVLNSNKDWWLCTKAEAETNAMFVTKNGELNREGESVVRAKGVRPCIWIEL